MQETKTKRTYGMWHLLGAFLVGGVLVVAVFMVPAGLGQGRLSPTLTGTVGGDCCEDLASLIKTSDKVRDEEFAWSDNVRNEEFAHLEGVIHESSKVRDEEFAHLESVIKQVCGN